MISTPMSKNEDMEKESFSVMEEFPSHPKLTRRIQKTLYYGHGHMPKTDRPSLPLTEIAVELFQESSPRDLGQVDTYLASTMARKACMSPCSMMLGMIFLERLRSHNPEYLQKVSSADLFFVSMMMASKYLYDEGTDDEVFNDEWAESADMDLEDLNKLERNFLSAIDWKLYVHPREFWNKLDQTERRIAWEQGCDRGWFSYTDVDVLTRDPAIRKLALALMAALGKMVLVCSVAYTAAVATLVASTMATMCLRERLPIPAITSPAALHPVTAPSINTFQQMSAGVDDGIMSSDSDLPSVGGNQLMSSGEAEGVIVGTGLSRGNDHEPGTKPGSVGIPGLLTLALLQDTVCQFMTGVADRFSTVYGQKSSSEEHHGNKGCNCSCVSKVDGSTTKNHTFMAEPIRAKDLRCTCGNREQARKSQESHNLRNLAGYQRNVVPMKNLWKKTLRRTREAMWKLSSWRHGCDQSEPPESEAVHLPGCVLDLHMPVSELAVMHGHTVTPLTVTT